MRLVSEGVRASRGRVRCDVCRRTIARGARYLAQTCADDADIWTWRECPACTEYHSQIGCDCYLDSEGCPPETLFDTASDALDLPATWLLTRRETTGERTARRCRQAEEADADPERAWGAGAWAAFRWRMRTSPAMYPDGVVGSVA